MPTNKVWEDKDGKYYHDACFEKGESKEGYEPVDLNDLDDEDTCESCGGVFLMGPADDDDDDDDDEEEVEKVA